MAADGPTAEADSPAELDPTKLEIVLFGIGDLRVHDHKGLRSALSSGSHVLPLFLMDADTLSKIPGGASHVLDTEMMVASSLNSLSSRLKDDVGLDLHVYSSENIMRFRDALCNVLDMVKKEQPTVEDITINVCDLGDADNRMGYGPYAYLEDGLEDYDSSVKLRSWDCSLRSEPWSDLNALPRQYPSYEKQYDIQSRAAIQPESVAAGTRHITIPALTEILIVGLFWISSAVLSTWILDVKKPKHCWRTNETPDCMERIGEVWMGHRCVRQKCC